ncbi:MAG TPA: DUF2490 domain-containing protein [Pyrinomonadaceae bacterium]|nr:DUF2490 domain-containing protein [Pyrinomonadaceae bacterium]
MRLQTPFVTLFFLLVTAAACSGQSTPPENDFQIWHETTFILPVVKAKDSTGKDFDRLSLLFIGSLRLGQNRLAPVDERVGGGFDLVLNKNWNVTPTYLYIAGQPARGRKEFEHRLRFEATFNQKFKNFSIKDRNRVEYRIRNARQDSVRYRNKFTFSVPWTKDGKEVITPYISTEPYYDFTAEQWSRNDLSPGFTKKFTDKLSGDFFYVWRANRTGLPKNVHALGFNLKVKLK